MLFKKHTSENYKSYLLSVGVLTGIMFLLMYFAAKISENYILNSYKQMEFFWGLLILAGTFFASTSFANLSDKKRAITQLTLPATRFEKYLVSWLYSVIIFLIVYTSIFYLVNISILHFFKQPGKVIKIFNIFAETDNNIFYSVFFSFAFVQSLAFLGSVWFKKAHYIKTAFTFFLFIIILQLLNHRFLEWFLEKDLNLALVFGPIAFLQNKEIVILDMSQEQAHLFSLMLLILSFILWTATYYRLKEKQI